MLGYLETHAVLTYKAIPQTPFNRETISCTIHPLPLCALILHNVSVMA